MPLAREKSAKGAQGAREDGRKRNGGTPPRQVAGAVRYSTAARSQMSHTARQSTAARVS